MASLWPLRRPDLCELYASPSRSPFFFIGFSPGDAKITMYTNGIPSDDVIITLSG